jgi:calcineurin-like phosphoesterase family protein
MKKIFLTSDLHFNHSAIIKYCNRPYRHLDEMDDALIKNWNSVVSDQDEVFVLGDFCFSPTPERYFNTLKGCKYLIKGNHDSRETMRLGWGWVKDVYTFKYNEHTIWMSHYPHRSWPKSYHGAFHFYGHCHGSMQDFGKSTDVGVDCWNYTPVEIDKLIDRLKNADIVDHHGRAD